VFGALFFHQRINRLGSSAGLQLFLQRRLEIHHRNRARFQFHVRQFRIDDGTQNEVPRNRPSTVEIERRQDRLQRIDQQCRLATAAAFFFSTAEAQILSDLELLGDAQQMPLPHQMRAQF
jgi:hypothetical protein